MTSAEIIKQAKLHLITLTGLAVDTVSGLRKDDEGWHITLEMVELRRIPEYQDVLATYETVLDGEGNLLRYERTRRYHRGDTEDM